MSISISPASTRAEHHEQVQAYIQQHMQKYIFKDKVCSSLPISNIDHIATFENIEAICAKEGPS